MAWAVLTYTLVVAILYIVLDIVLPSSLKKRRRHPGGDVAHEREHR
jgi:hypothetical protein